MAETVLFRDRGCPYAARIRAVLAHLDLDYEDRACAIGDRPPGLEAVSPAGRIPALLHRGQRLYDSRVICDWLAETHGWTDAWPTDPDQRALHKLAVMVHDDRIAAPWLRSYAAGTPTPPDPAEVAELDRLLADCGPPRPGMLQIHLAPFPRFYALTGLDLGARQLERWALASEPALAQSLG